MSYASTLSNIFPGVTWTGESSIHVSLFAEGNLDMDPSNRPAILYALMQKNI